VDFDIEIAGSRFHLFLAACSTDIQNQEAFFGAIISLTTSSSSNPKQF